MLVLFYRAAGQPSHASNIWAGWRILCVSLVVFLLGYWTGRLELWRLDSAGNPVANGHESVVQQPTGDSLVALDG